MSSHHSASQWDAVHRVEWSDFLWIFKQKKVKVNSVTTYHTAPSLPQHACRLVWQSPHCAEELDSALWKLCAPHRTQVLWRSKTVPNQSSSCLLPTLQGGDCHSATCAGRLHYTCLHIGGVCFFFFSGKTKQSRQAWNKKNGKLSEVSLKGLDLL